MSGSHTVAMEICTRPGSSMGFVSSRTTTWFRTDQTVRPDAEVQVHERLLCGVPMASSRSFCGTAPGGMR